MVRFHILDNQSQRRIFALSAIMLLLVATIDYLTGFEISFSVFYLIPIAMVAWFVNDRRAGIMAAVIGSVVWLAVDRLSGRSYSSDLIPLWNAGVRLSFFLIVTYALSSLRAAEMHREELSHFIVHDLRSPLSNTLTGLQYLLDFSGDDLDASQRDLVQLSLASGNRMLTLVNSLLDLAQLESGQLKLNLQLSVVQKLFDTAFQQLSAMAARGEVCVVSKIAPGAESVLADGELTIRVLVNVISNALKYSPTGTDVTVRAYVYDDKYVGIQVIDNGAGIPKEWAEKVFDKFAQVEARKQGVAIGSGLGLTFCRLAIEAQGGRIWLSSVVGQGTTVTFILPRH